MSNNPQLESLTAGLPILDSLWRDAETRLRHYFSLPLDDVDIDAEGIESLIGALQVSFIGGLAALFDSMVLNARVSAASVGRELREVHDRIKAMQSASTN